MKKLGFIINPIAGMGGSVGLKGTDGVFKKALELGAVPGAPDRARKALMELKDIKENIEVLTCSGNMGSDIALNLGFKARTVYKQKEDISKDRDTIAAAKAMMEEKADLILFAGGDGTARDIYNATGDGVPVVGIPAGVKIHSPIYAQNPKKAGELAKLFLTGKITRTEEAEVLDIDEDAFRTGKVVTNLCGYLKVPYERKYTQSSKAGSPISEKANQNTISFEIIDNMEKDVFYIIGPGTTTRPIMDNLNLPNTLLGVDVILNKKLVVSDAAEKDLLGITKCNKTKLVITPIGGQGYLFGRGNQQISPEVLRNLGKENIIVAATKQKISELHGKPFLVDTGEDSVDDMLGGYIRVITGYKESMIYRIDH